MKIKIHSFINFLCFVIIMKPGGFALFDILDKLFDYGKIFCCLILLISIIRQKRISNLSIVVFIQQLLLLFSTLLMHGDFMQYVKQAGSNLAGVLLVEKIVRDKDTEGLNSISIYSTMLICSNTALTITMPSGFGAFSHNSIQYLLGMDNRFLYSFVPLLSLIGINSINRTDGFDFRFIISFFSSLFILIYKWSVGAILAYLLMIILFVITRNNYTRILNIRNYYIYYLFLFLFVVIFKGFAVFSNLIINFLGKDLTLSNRVYLWDRALSIFYRYPILGVGMQSESTLYQYFGNVVHPHNEILFLLYSSGIVGTLTFIILLIQCGRKIMRYKELKISGFTAILLIALLFALLTDSFDYSSGLIMVIACCYFVHEFDLMKYISIDKHLNIRKAFVA